MSKSLLKNTRILIIGHVKRKYEDEGLKIITRQYTTYLSRLFNFVKVIDINEIHKNFLKMFFSKPHIIYIIAGPSSSKIFIMIAMLRIFFPKTKIVFIASQFTIRKLSFFVFVLANIFKPSIVFTQSPTSEIFFKNMGYNVQLIPNGTETSRFKPMSGIKKRKIRKIYGIDNNDFVLLHIGPLKKGRGVEFLIKHCDSLKNVKILWIARRYDIDVNLYKSVALCPNIKILRGFFQNIEHFYAAANVYIFLAESNYHAIDMPLTIIEALASGLPVITNKRFYYIFSRFLNEYDLKYSLILTSTNNDFLKTIEKLKKTYRNRINELYKEREKFEKKFSWENIIKNVVKLSIN